MGDALALAAGLNKMLHLLARFLCAVMRWSVVRAGMDAERSACRRVLRLCFVVLRGIEFSVVSCSSVIIMRGQGTVEDA